MRVCKLLNINTTTSFQCFGNQICSLELLLDIARVLICARYENLGKIIQCEERMRRFSNVQVIFLVRDLPCTIIPSFFFFSTRKEKVYINDVFFLAVIQLSVYSYNSTMYSYGEE